MGEECPAAWLSQRPPSTPERLGLHRRFLGWGRVLAGRQGYPELSPWKVKYKSSTCPDTGRFLSQDFGQDASPFCIRFLIFKMELVSSGFEELVI